MNTYKSIRDVEQFISDQRIDQYFYQMNYIQTVASEYLDLLRSRGFYWGGDIPEISDEEFWDCWRSSERQKVTLNGKKVDFDACVNAMDDDLRESVHDQAAYSLTDQEFLDAYCEMHAKEFEEEFTV